jgi:hypothetical protein
MEAINRRTFGKWWGITMASFTLGGEMFMIGCASFTQILAWVQTGLDTFQSVADLLAGNGVITIVIGSAIDLIIKAIKAAIADIGTAVDNYNNAPAASKATLLGKITEALIAAQNEIGQFWNDLAIPDPKVASTTAGLLGLIVSQLSAFQASMPVTTATRVQIQSFPKKLSAAAPKMRSIGDFKKEFVQVLETNGYSQYRHF